jgi:transposase
MAGTFAGLTDWAWQRLVELFPPPPKRRRGMPHTPLRKIVNPLRSGLITGGRWGDLPRGPQWASKSTAQRGLQRWQNPGPLAAMPARILEGGEEQGMIHWPYGAVAGSFSPWHRRWCGRGLWPARPRPPQPSSYGRRWYASGGAPHACHWG